MPNKWKTDTNKKGLPFYFFIFIWLRIDRVQQTSDTDRKFIVKTQRYVSLAVSFVIDVDIEMGVLGCPCVLSNVLRFSSQPNCQKTNEKKGILDARDIAQ